MKRPAKVSANELFSRVLAGLGPYRAGVVLVGGFARDLYRNLEGFADLALRPPGTNDVDFAIGDPLQLYGDSRLHETLLAAGLRYRPRIGLDHETAACAYYPAELVEPKPTDPHVEFITPLRGPDREQNARPQGDELYAYSLRFVELLLEDPVTVHDAVHGSVRIPHPLAYVVQKTRIRSKRHHEGKAAKDQADAFFVVVSLQSVWQEWRPRWDHLKQQSEQSAWLRDTLRIWNDLYSTAESPGAREVSAAYPSFPAATVCRVMSDFQRTFG